MYRHNIKTSSETGFNIVEIINDSDLRLTLRYRDDPRYPGHLQVYFNSNNHPNLNRRDNNVTPTIWKTAFINKNRPPFLKSIYNNFNHISFHLDNKGNTTNRLVNFHFSNPENIIYTKFKNMDAEFSPIMSVIRKYNSRWEMISLIQKFDRIKRGQHIEEIINNILKESLGANLNLDTSKEKEILKFMISNPEDSLTRLKILDKIVEIFKKYPLEVDLKWAEEFYNAFESESKGRLDSFDINHNYCIMVSNDVSQDNIFEWKNTFGFENGMILCGNYGFSRFATMPDEKTMVVGYY